MGFSFRLEALLKYRAHRKERAEVELGRARKRLNEAREALEALQNRLLEAGEELRLSLRGRASANFIRSHADFVSGLERRILAGEAEVARRRGDVRDRVKEVLERTREVRIVEKLEERDHQAWLREEQRQEQNVLDEIAVIRHGRTFA
ncbi:MAG: flagellar export protein FliJ [Deltaproteobacteria bacterium]|nr:flagellar export protein FliJ [Deltaproteobacteria bacterium]